MNQPSGAVVVEGLRAEYVPRTGARHRRRIAEALVDHAPPTLAGWMQAAYEIELDGVTLGRVDSDESVFVPWPGAPLVSRARASRARPGVGHRRVGVDVERTTAHRSRSPVGRRLDGALDRRRRRTVR